MEKREKSSRKLILIVFIPFLAFVLLQLFAPLILETGSVDDLSGSVGLTDNSAEINEYPFPLDKLYDCGDVMCHQRSDRSFILNENQMPFCARCFAIWLGITLGLGFMLFFKIEVDVKFIYLIVISLTPIGIDGVGQMLGFWESTNFMRFVTGVFIGFICGIAIGIIIDELWEMYRARKITN